MSVKCSVWIKKSHAMQGCVLHTDLSLNSDFMGFLSGSVFLNSEHNMILPKAFLNYLFGWIVRKPAMATVTLNGIEQSLMLFVTPVLFQLRLNARLRKGLLLEL